MLFFLLPPLALHSNKADKGRLHKFTRRSDGVYRYIGTTAHPEYSGMFGIRDSAYNPVSGQHWPSNDVTQQWADEVTNVTYLRSSTLRPNTFGAEVVSVRKGGRETRYLCLAVAQAVYRGS